MSSNTTGLKTQKDIITKENYSSAWPEPNILNKERQEAIKWIKLLWIKRRDLCLVEGTPFIQTKKQELDVVRINAKVDWIKHFFNITDEELK